MGHNNPCLALLEFVIALLEPPHLQSEISLGTVKCFC